MKAVVTKKGIHLKPDSDKMLPFRQEVGWAALNARTKAGFHELVFGKDVSVGVYCTFYFAPVKNSPKIRIHPAVKPDIDKLCRCIFDALTGVLYVDDGQVTDLYTKKRYGLPERVEILVASITE